MTIERFPCFRCGNLPLGIVVQQILQLASYVHTALSRVGETSSSPAGEASEVGGAFRKPPSIHRIELMILRLLPKCQELC
jgi:hypothetical protein